MRERFRATTRCSREDIDVSPVSTLSASEWTSALTAWISRWCVSSTQSIKALMSCLVGRACSSAQISPSSRLASSFSEELAISDKSGRKSAGVSAKRSETEKEVGRRIRHGLTAHGGQGRCSVCARNNALFPPGRCRIWLLGLTIWSCTFSPLACRCSRCLMSAMCRDRQGKPGAHRRQVLIPPCPGHAPRDNSLMYLISLDDTM